MKSVYEGESSEGKANLAKTSIQMRNAGVEEDADDMRMSRTVAQELVAVRSIMQRYGLSREEAEKALEKFGGIKEYLKSFGAVEFEDHNRNSRVLGGIAKGIRGVKDEQDDLKSQIERGE